MQIYRKSGERFQNILTSGNTALLEFSHHTRIRTIFRHKKRMLQKSPAFQFDISDRGRGFYSHRPQFQRILISTGSLAGTEKSISDSIEKQRHLIILHHIPPPLIRKLAKLVSSLINTITQRRKWNRQFLYEISQLAIWWIQNKFHFLVIGSWIMMIKIRFFNDVRKMYSTYFSFIRVSKLFMRSTIVSGAISKQA